MMVGWEQWMTEIGGLEERNHKSDLCTLDKDVVTQAAQKIHEIPAVPKAGESSFHFGWPEPHRSCEAMLETTMKEAVEVHPASIDPDFVYGVKYGFKWY